MFNTVSVNAQVRLADLPHRAAPQAHVGHGWRLLRATSDLIRIQPNRRYVARAVASGNPGTGTGVTLRASIQAFQSDGTTSITTSKTSRRCSIPGSAGFYELETPEIGFDNAYYVKVHLTQYNQTGRPPSSVVLRRLAGRGRARPGRRRQLRGREQHVRHPAGLARPGAGAALGPLRRRGRRQRKQQENDKVTWRALVRGDTSDEAVAALRGHPGGDRSGPTDLALEWRAGSVLNSTFFPLRGPAEFELAHEAIPAGGGPSGVRVMTFRSRR